jgi:hypothetical protein
VTLTMDLAIATHRWQGWQDCVASWNDHATGKHLNFIVEHLPVLEAYQIVYEQTGSDIIAHVHDDVMIYEYGWDERVLRQFDDPKVGLVGFAGALGHGRPDMYDPPYEIAKMVRLHFMSNMRTAEQHGHRFTGESDVAVLDGLALFVRREILDLWDGWPLDEPYGFWMYSEALCCETRRQGYRIRVVGVDCDHLGGKTSSVANVQDSYEDAHRWFWEQNRDVMPFDVTTGVVVD